MISALPGVLKNIWALLPDNIGLWYSLKLKTEGLYERLIIYFAYFRIYNYLTKYLSLLKRR